ncbi:TolC family protein [Candidatus Saganbacteria bacterium]|nr:TolC family protein [Candidatus Saganbacteria bacterium]
MRDRIIGCLIIIIFSTTGAFAASLNEVVKTALEHNPEIAAAKADWEAAKAKIPQTLSLEDPRVGLEYEQIPSGSRNPEDGMKMYTFEQMVMFPGKIYAEWKMANQDAEMARARYLKKVREILAMVQGAYFDLFFIDRSLKINAENQELLSRLKRSAEAKYSVGQVTQADPLMAAAEAEMVANELLNAGNERKAAEARLGSLLNQPVGGEPAADETLSFPKVMDPAFYEKAAAANRPEILEMKAELEALDAAQLKSKMEYFPDTALGVKKRVDDGWDAMISISIPLYFWKQSFGVSAAGLRRETAEAALNNMRNMTIAEVRETQAMAENAERTVKLYADRLLPLAAQAVKISQAAYQTGKVDFITFLGAQRSYRDAQLKYAENQVKLGKALAMLEKIIGGEIK